MGRQNDYNLTWGGGISPKESNTFCVFDTFGIILALWCFFLFLCNFDTFDVFIFWCDLENLIFFHWCDDPQAAPV